MGKSERLRVFATYFLLPIPLKEVCKKFLNSISHYIIYTCLLRYKCCVQILNYLLKCGILYCRYHEKSQVIFLSAFLSHFTSINEYLCLFIFLSLTNTAVLSHCVVP